MPQKRVNDIANRAVLLLLVFVWATPIAGQTQSRDCQPNEATSTSSVRLSNEVHVVEFGKTHQIESKVLSESRTLLISVPQSYQSGKRSYPVIYLLDGRSNFLHTVSAARFLAANRRIPESIVVGIVNTNRTRDLTPKSEAKADLEQYKGAGGADEFHRFIATELVPWVDGKFRTTKDRVLIGHSFGGLFAVHVLLEHPETFQRYLAISPSLWWSDLGLVEKIEERLADVEKAKSLKGRIFMTLGNEKGKMLEGLTRTEKALKKSAPESLSWKYQLLDQETHLSVPYLSTYHGLEFVLKGAKREIVEKGN